MKRFTIGILLFAATAISADAPIDPSILSLFQWRSAGPNRGGRSTAAAGSSARPLEYYFGATGGGLWKTTDGGLTWRPVTDGQIHSSSVGAVAVAASNPDVVYIGMGETELRGNIMQGDGVYKTTDAGRTWKHVGLESTQAIARVRISPTNPDLVYVAALGHPYAPNAERGVYRSKDGGQTWQQILHRDDRTGAVDLCLDPNNPNVIYASLWEVNRTPWGLTSGGPGSGLFKSTDGGDTWKEITRNPGLPQIDKSPKWAKSGLREEGDPGIIGKITVAVSKPNPIASMPWLRTRMAAFSHRTTPAPHGRKSATITISSNVRFISAAYTGIPKIRTRFTFAMWRYISRQTAERLTGRCGRRTATITTCGSTRTIR